MPSGITRARVTSCCSLVRRISAASRSLFNAGSDWVGSCAITIKRRRDPTPKVQSWNCGSARCDWEIEQVEDAALLPVTPTLRSGKLDRPVKYSFPPFEYFDHTGSSDAPGGLWDLDAVTEPDPEQTLTARDMCNAT